MKKPIPLFLLVLLDILQGVLVFALFFFFLQLLPQTRLAQQLNRENQAVPAVSAVPAENTAAPAATPGGSSETAAEDAAEAETSPAENETQTERFHEQFRAAVQRTDDSYRGPGTAVTVTKHENTEKNFVYFVADIYIKDPADFVACFSPDFATALPEKIAKENSAIIAMNGDFFLNIHDGFAVRNGTVYQREEGTLDICVLYADGRMQTFEAGSYDVEEILREGPRQVWQFGPALLDESGQARENFHVSRNIFTENPRSALGYFEPGHYCFVVVDGRQPYYSAGADMDALAAIFEEMGCVCAYNLDGGASTYLIFDGEVVNHPAGGLGGVRRQVSDMLGIRIPENTETAEESLS